ncbi:MAG TPA: restriction endonuclease [Sediminibacterium sp.]
MSNRKTDTFWKEYEDLIYRIYKELEPVGDVRINDSILGIESNTKRQIDISIRKNIAGHEILIIIQAKNLKRSVDLTIIGEFDSVIRDVRASKGILICNKGFTKQVKEYAQKRKIDICTAHDASNIDWQTEIQIPVIKKNTKVSVTIRHRSVILEEGDISGIEMPYPIEAFSKFLKAWEDDKLDKTPGTHIYNLERESIKIPIKSMPLQSHIEYTVQDRYHFKFFIPTDYRGIKDYITQNFTPSFIEFKETIPYLNDGTWKYIADPSEVSLSTSHLQIEIISLDFFKKQLVRTYWAKNP